MNRMTLQNVRSVLADLEEDPEYRALNDSGVEEQFNALRKEVDIAGIRCLEWQPDGATTDEIEGRIERMLGLCVGKLSRFKPYIERAQTVLHGT